MDEFQFILTASKRVACIPTPPQHPRLLHTLAKKIVAPGGPETLVKGLRFAEHHLQKRSGHQRDNLDRL